MRRGSWTFNKSRDRHKKATPKQRARSNSVPAVLDISTQLLLFRQLQSSIPDIIVSPEEAEKAEEEDCFVDFPVDDVVEGFSWTLAETIIEEILKEMETSRNPGLQQLCLPPGIRKGILKNASNDSLHSEDPPPPLLVQTPCAEELLQISWSHRSTSMPSLRAIDHIEAQPLCQVSFPLATHTHYLLPASGFRFFNDFFFFSPFFFGVNQLGIFSVSSFP